MTESTERAMEYVFAGFLFCMALSILLWMHGATIQQWDAFGKEPERVIFFERAEE